MTKGGAKRSFSPVRLTAMLVSCPRNTGTKSMQFFEDRVGGGGPLERLAVCVVVGDEVIDALCELFDAGERAAADRLGGNQREEPFDLIEPGAVGRDEVHVPARSRRQRCLDLRMAVGSVVVHAVDVQFGGRSSDRSSHRACRRGVFQRPVRDRITRTPKKRPSAAVRAPGSPRPNCLRAASMRP